LADKAYPNIFVAGDVADTGDLKMAYKAGLHSSIITKNIISLLKSQAPTAIYKPTTDSEMMTLPMGKLGGVSYLSFFGGMFPKGSRLIFRIYTRQLGHQDT